MKSKFKAEGSARLALPTAALMAFGLTTSYAFADVPLRTETVTFQDLDVSKPAGVEALYGRIHSAARRVCAETGKMQQPRAFACAKRAEAHVIGTLNMPLLTEYYQIKTGGRTQTLSAHR
jgi:UrcA family protein